VPLQTFSGRRASQSYFELFSFHDFLIKNNVTHYLEIGARHGDTFHYIMSNLPKGSKGVAVDLPGGLWGRSNSVISLKQAVHDLNRKGYDCSCILGDSKTSATLQQIAIKGPYDAIFIDGDHTLEGVTADWNNFKNKARIIAFHDIVGTGQFEKVHRNPVEVPKLWDKLKAQYNHVEFIDTDSKMGIGCLFL